MQKSSTYNLSLRCSTLPRKAACADFVATSQRRGNLVQGRESSSPILGAHFRVCLWVGLLQIMNPGLSRYKMEILKKKYWQGQPCM